jgi:hypothetical protein
MNRSIILLGVAIILAGLALVASPIVLTGAGLLVVMIGAVQANPAATTVGGTFGNPDANPRRSPPAHPAGTGRPPLGFNPREPVSCRYCRTVIAFDLAFCPRCARARECRECGRTLGMAETQTDCPGCHRQEAFCNCPRVARAVPRPAVGSSRTRWG